MLTPSIQRSLKVGASVKGHPPTTASGVRSAPVLLFELKVAPIDPVDPMLSERLRIEAPLQSKQTFAYTKENIAIGMYLVVGTKEYPIRGASVYEEENGFKFYHLILEDIVVS